MEAIGIGLVGPFIALASNPQFIYQNPWLHWLYTKLGFQKSSFIATLGSLTSDGGLVALLDIVIERVNTLSSTQRAAFNHEMQGVSYRVPRSR